MKYQKSQVKGGQQKQYGKDTGATSDRAVGGRAGNRGDLLWVFQIQHHVQDNDDLINTDFYFDVRDNFKIHDQFHTDFHVHVYNFCSTHFYFDINIGDHFKVHDDYFYGYVNLNRYDYYFDYNVEVDNDNDDLKLDSHWRCAGTTGEPCG